MKELRDRASEGWFKTLGAAIPVPIQGVTAHGIKPGPPQPPAMGAVRGFTLGCDACGVHDCHTAYSGESGNRAIGSSAHRFIENPELGSMTFRRVLGGGKYRQEFVGLFLEICQSRRGHDSPIGSQLQPEHDFVGLFYHDAHPGNEFSS
jgi:hypothetical protein